MEVSFEVVLDLIRFMTGLIAVEYVFVDCNCIRKNNFYPKFIFGTIVLNIACMSYFPVKAFCDRPLASSVIMAIWWSVFSLLTILLLLWCYDAAKGTILFYYIWAVVVEGIISLILRYIIVGYWNPNFPTDYPIAYMLLLLSIYGVVLWAARRFIACKLAIGDEESVFNHKNVINLNLTMILLFTLLMDASRGLFDWIVSGESLGNNELLMKRLLPAYLMVLMAVLGLFLMTFMVFIYRIVVLYHEQAMMDSLQKQRESQYTFSKENIDLINQKCHDLKHQLKALQMVGDEEKEKLYMETNRAINMYDASIHTGNDVLDTILTEKNLICTARDIKLSCNVSNQPLDFMSVVDLYTIMANALDNAIEAVSDYPMEKRVISLMMKRKEMMMIITVENYFDGKLVLKNGNPITSKADKKYHGFGIKSIRMIANKYQGDIRISQNNNTFSLQIMIPIE